MQHGSAHSDQYHFPNQTSLKMVKSSRGNKRRSSSGFGAALSLSAPLSAEAAASAAAMIESNDDQAEREQLRLVRNSSNESAEKLQTKEISPEELSEIFKETLRLSAAGKINAKNTWDLPLIEHMDEFIGQQDESALEYSGLSPEDHVNFQKASFTIDASVKIYSSRVDSVHNQTYKVLGGLHRNAKEEKEVAEDNIEGSPKKTTQRVSKKSTLVSSIATITEKSLDSSSIGFSMISECTGFLMDQLTLHNGCTVVANDSKATEHTEDSSSPLPQDIVDRIISIAESSTPLFPDAYRFYLNAVDDFQKSNPEPVKPYQTIDEPLYLDNNYSEPEDLDALDNFEFDGDFQEDQNTQSNNMVMQLSSGVNEYSWYDPKSLKHLSGLSHWKLASNKVSQSLQKTQKSRKKSKPQEPLDLLQLSSPLPNLCPSVRRSITLSQAQLDKQRDDADSLLLPLDYNVKKEDLMTLFTRPGTTVHMVLEQQKLPIAHFDTSLGDDFVDTGNFDPLPLDDSPLFIEEKLDSLQLISEPQRAQKVEISYAKFSKKVDVRALKSSMWNSIVPTKEQSFQALIENVGALLPKNDLEAVSVPFYFISLLHLANEHSLQLEQRDTEFGDFRIVQE